MNTSDTSKDFMRSGKFNAAYKRIMRTAVEAQGSAQYVIMTWNHRTCPTGRFSFRGTLESAKALALEYCGYLKDNQAQVSVAGKHPVMVVFRVWNQNGTTKEL